VDASAKVVVVGAGVVGCSVAQHLTRLGWRDVTVIDQGPLFETGGSTSHAPGLVFQTNPSETMTRFASYTVRHFGELARAGKECWHPVGSIEVARTAERLEWIKLRYGLATAWGVPASLLGSAEVAAKVPLLDPDRILGGLYVASDGVAKAVWAAEAMAEEAGARGARFQAHTEVTGFEVSDGRVRAVETSKGLLPADVVVSCAGIWGPLIGAMVGARIPLLPLQHQLAWTTPLEELAGEKREVVHPILRDQDRAMYFRQRRDHYAVGSYQHTPLPVAPESILTPEEAPEMPSLLPFTPDDFKQAWADALELLPALRDAEMAEARNGLFSFTPDGMPLIGESRDVRGFWVAEAVWITHSAGVGKATAEWIATGAPSLDLRECDLARFDSFAYSPAYVIARGCQQYDEVYDVIHPLQPMEEPRPLRVSPWHRRQEELGAFCLEFNGWERPHFYEANSALAEGRDLRAPNPWAARFWSPIVGAEHLVTRERAALFDMTTLKRAEVSGPGALGLLQRLTTGQLDRPPGYVTYALMLDDNAGIRSDITVARLGPNRFQLGLNGPRDIDWLERNLPSDGTVCVSDITPGTCCIGLWGPGAREVVQRLSEDDFSNEGFGFFRARRVFVGEVPVVALRLSYVGELGWELYTTADLGLRLWDLLWRAGQPLGLIAAGRGAFNGLRLEKGYRSWGQDMWSAHDPYEAGLGFAVRTDKEDFLGRAALLRRREEGARRRLCCLVIDDGTVVMGKEPVYANGDPVGHVTSAAYGYSVDRSIAYAWVPPELATEGSAVEVEYFAERHPATVAPDPLFDPEMRRMRG
jgi:glycine cleavage system aminomethyltransferase T/glycine/D-amino acid oxidase-like deaminating enzyme